jgi:chaperonin GroES
MNFHPFSDRVLVRRLEESSAAVKGGLVVPDAAKEKPSEGTIVAVGPGSVDVYGNWTRMQSNVGDHVFFGKYGGTEIELPEGKFLVMHESEILGSIPQTPLPPPEIPAFSEDGLPF